jgi:hypothetical protein
MQGERTRRPVVAVIYETVLRGATYRNWTDAVFLGALTLALMTVVVYMSWHRRPEIADGVMGMAAIWGLLAGFFYGQWRAVEPGSFQSVKLRVRSSNFLGGFCFLLLLILLQRVTGI